MFRDDMKAAMARALAAEKQIEVLESEAAARQEEIAAFETTVAQLRADNERLRKLAGEEEAARSLKEEQERAANEKAGDQGMGQEKPRRSILRFLLAHKAGAAGLLAAVLVVGGVPVCGLYCADRHDRVGPGELYQAHRVQRAGGRGEAMLLIDEVEPNTEFRSRSAWRLSLIDPAAGTLVARVILDRDDHRPEVLPAAPGRFWIKLGRPARLEVREVSTLRVLGTWDALCQRNPALKAGIHGGVQVDGWRGGAIITTKQGQQIHVDSKTLRGAAFSSARQVMRVDGRGLLRAAVQSVLGPVGDDVKVHALSAEKRTAVARLPVVRALGRSQHGTKTSVTSRTGPSFDFTSVSGSPRRTLHRRDPGTYRAAPVPGAASLLEPVFVQRYGGEDRSLRLPGGAGFVVRHKDSLELNSHKLEFSRVGVDGKIAWTVTRDRGSVKTGVLVGDVLLIAVAGALHVRSYLLAVAWRDGSMRWLYKL